jgi:hypothetical protein
MINKLKIANKAHAERLGIYHCRHCGVAFEKHASKIALFYIIRIDLSDHMSRMGFCFAMTIAFPFL